MTNGKNNTVSAESPTVDVSSKDDSVVTRPEFEGELKELKNEIRGELRKESDSAKKQYIEIFGIFAAILSFLIIEIQAFNKLDSFPKLAGFSLLLTAMVLILLSGIQNIASEKNIFKNQIFWIGLIFLLLSFVFFWYQVTGKLVILDKLK